MKLKKIWTVCLTAALLLSVGATGAFAARFGQGQGDCKRDCLSKETCTSACRFADEDGDGLCDLCGRAAGRRTERNGRNTECAVSRRQTEPSSDMPTWLSGSVRST